MTIFRKQERGTSTCGRIGSVRVQAQLGQGWGEGETEVTKLKGVASGVFHHSL